MNSAILMLSIAAAIGFLGSYLWGWLDMVIGPKKASVGIILWYCVALVVVLLPFNTITLYLSLLMIGMGIGGVANLAASLTGSIFGRYEFGCAYGIINPIMGVVRVSAFAVLAFGLSLAGGYNSAYTIFLVLNIVAVILMLFVKEDFISEPKKIK